MISLARNRRYLNENKKMNVNYFLSNKWNIMMMIMIMDVYLKKIVVWIKKIYSPYDNCGLAKTDFVKKISTTVKKRYRHMS
jgi:hypothetical protein